MSSLAQDQETQQTPLLIKTNQTHNILHEDQENDDNNLDNGLQRLDFYLLLMGFNQDSFLRFGLSWFMFLIIGVVVPVVVLLLTTNCLRCDLYQVKEFELVVVSSHACLAAVALLGLSHNLRKYGVRKFLFVDQYHGHVQRFSKDYVLKIDVSSIAQVVWVILCLNAVAKISHRAQGIAALASRWHALASCGPDGRKGNYYRYLAEFKSGNVKKVAANQSLKAYQLASTTTEAYLSPTLHIRLGLTLNFFVFYYKNMNPPKRCTSGKFERSKALRSLLASFIKTFRLNSWNMA
ncbi:hypothetical protein Tco_0875244 [Tanacetum coccineum]|uniref:14-3-3 domain-containing protein n=1 Tax=Tanacetum coccineum TaxID=301880 RepID=A0ABQ5BPN5_9ASTR